ncbi:class I SAM-dependent methyltransferase [Xylophilus rhododendri]|uniref:Class I SAM-dependent methyltransferase n=1 Tax=Xylophilus rhododendri TaxID=2697032 RepID=A0A857J6H9_9BURK|nr:SAM-dependent methyltransferase [Xylophilus rhododendri]QHI98398.1 class I SAM-dependent methyltransferase [Xylophilus rhododendri]
MAVFCSLTASSAGASAQPPEPSDALARLIAGEIAGAGGWIGFDRFMALALYAPGAGYYTRDAAQFGRMPDAAGGGGDFVTGPELSPLFGRALAVQVADALEASGTDEVWEFGAGTGALARELLGALGERVSRYTIVDLSGTLRARQQQTLAAFGERVRWADSLPERIEGVVVGNEVLDAMPVQLLARKQGEWFERGVCLGEAGAFAWSDRPTALRPPVDIPGPHDYLTEIHPQGRGFVATLGDRLARGAAFLIDYGFPEAEYYHPQRHMGTVMCHRAHRADSDPLADVGDKDITAHVDFTGVALAAQDAGLELLGYTSQGHFLYNCGLGAMLEALPQAQRNLPLLLVNEHEMGELFKVIALGRELPPEWMPVGFAHGDRSHRL